MSDQAPVTWGMDQLCVHSCGGHRYTLQVASTSFEIIDVPSLNKVMSSEVPRDYHWEIHLEYSQANPL